MRVRTALKAILLSGALTLLFGTSTIDICAEPAAAYIAADICAESAAAYELYTPEPVENASAETPAEDACLPAHWSNNTWGAHEAVFTYCRKGHSGSRSLKVAVSGYEDGDAKWFFEPVDLAPGDYTFTDYYRSNVDTRVVAAVRMTSGNMRYIDLPNAPVSSDWKKYEAVFTVPERAEAVTIYHLLDRDGYLVTDDYSIRPYRYAGFEHGMVTLTFDDGWEENGFTALPVMERYGYQSNQFYATAFIEHPWVADPKARIQPFIDAGHEIGSHSVSHPRLTGLPAGEVQEELSQSKAFLEDYLDIDIAYFATPYGAYNPFVKAAIMEHYAAHRTVDRGYNSRDTLDLSRLKSQSILSVTTPGEVSRWVKKAKEERLWLILLYHRVTAHPGPYDTTPEMFEKHMQAIRDADIPVVTFSEAIAEIEQPYEETAVAEIVVVPDIPALVFAASIMALPAGLLAAMNLAARIRRRFNVLARKARSGAF